MVAEALKLLQCESAELGLDLNVRKCELVLPDSEPSDKLPDLFPPGLLVDPDTGATVPVDLIFLGGGLPVNRSKDSFALFAEANVPVSNSLEANLAARFEELETDSSIDSKLGIKWNLTEAITLRASGSTTFREPSLIQTYNQETSLQGLVDPLTGSSSALFVQVNSTGNTDLKPETSINFKSISY